MLKILKLFGKLAQIIKKYPKIAIPLIGVALVCMVIPIAPYLDKQSFTVTITKTERKNEGSSSKYMVYGLLDNGKVRAFENTDSWSLFAWKTNSSNVQGMLEEGKTYILHTYGFRNTWFSSYENILRAEPVTQ